MDFIWVLFAFICGFGVKLIGLPPLIGFLCAGFVLHFLGVQPTESLDQLANLGITLMLFTIGLKLHIRDLLKREVWACTLTHMGLWTILFGSLALLLSSLSLPFFTAIDMQTAAILGFALSFSSTVCIIKLLEESGEMKTRHGQLSIAVLVMQDIAAVIFLVFATGKTPSLWAALLLGLPFIRPLLARLLSQAGHGELLPLTGFFLALGGYEIFQLVGVKGDLGALVIGMLLSNHSKATELSKALLNFKDIFLIGFFLSIGFTALPDWSMLGAAALLCLLIALKFLLFFYIFTRLQMRSRTAYLSALTLANFSEFGLIVAAYSVDSGWLPKEWLVIMALAVSISFIVTSVLYPHTHQFYMKHRARLKRFETSLRLPADSIRQPKGIEVIIIGLGRVGKGAFKSLEPLYGERLLGLDSDLLRVTQLQAMNMKVCYGDGEDADLWESFDIANIRLILLALPSIEDSRNITLQLRNAHYRGQIAAIAHYEDERQQLLDAGIDSVFNVYTEAGAGFAEESLQLLDTQHTQNS